MRSDGPENHRPPIEMEGESVFHRDGPFPSVFSALDFLDPEGRVTHIREKQLQLFLECSPDFEGQ